MLWGCDNLHTIVKKSLKNLQIVRLSEIPVKIMGKGTGQKYSFDHETEVLVCSGDDPENQLCGLCGADPFHFVFLKHNAPVPIPLSTCMALAWKGQAYF